MMSINMNARFNGPTIHGERKLVQNLMRSSSVGAFARVHLPRLDNAKGISSTSSLRICYWSSNRVNMFYWPTAWYRKHMSHIINNNIRSDCSLDPYEVDDISKSKEGPMLKEKTYDLVGSAVKSKSENVKRELIRLTLPAIGGHALEPLAQLMETAFIGRLGHSNLRRQPAILSHLITVSIIIFGLHSFGNSRSKPADAVRPLHQLDEPVDGKLHAAMAYARNSYGPVELASAGISVSIFNVISKIFNMPLLSVATSFVAEDISRNASSESFSDGGFQDGSSNGKPHAEISERKQLASVSTALFLASGIGIFEALALYLGSGLFLNMMGISTASSMRVPAQQFLSLRAVGAPAVVLSLALKGVFHGFKDMKTPSLCLGAGNLSAVFLFPLLMYSLRLGIIGAAIATVISQYIVTFLMIWYLSKKVILLPPKIQNLRFDTYMKSGGFLLVRTLALLFTMTLGTSMAARQGPLAMAAHQICMQVWLAVSLLTDALAASGQALIASSFSKGDYGTVKEITYYLLKAGLLAGIFLAVSLGVSFGSLATLFTKDAAVLDIVRSLALFVCASQPLNALAFIADGAYYGVSDFAYAACSMVIIGAISSALFLCAPPVLGLPGVWLGLVICMALRTLAGYIRLMSKNGPWWFLHRDSNF